jgi:hypothetical protein
VERGVEDLRVLERKDDLVAIMVSSLIGGGFCGNQLTPGGDEWSTRHHNMWASPSIKPQAVGGGKRFLQEVRKNF